MVTDFGAIRATHEMWLDYYREAWAKGVDVGSLQSAEHSLTLAAHHASIATALRARSTQSGDRV